MKGKGKFRDLPPELADMDFTGLVQAIFRTPPDGYESPYGIASRRWSFRFGDVHLRFRFGVVGQRLYTDAWEIRGIMHAEGFSATTFRGDAALCRREVVMLRVMI